MTGNYRIGTISKNWKGNFIMFWKFKEENPITHHVYLEIYHKDHTFKETLNYNSQEEAQKVYDKLTKIIATFLQDYDNILEYEFGDVYRFLNISGRDVIDIQLWIAEA